MKCRECGREIENESRFCPYCGEKQDAFQKDTNETFGGNAEQSDVLQKIRDIIVHWRDYCTLANMEKLIALNMLVPLCYRLVLLFTNPFLNVLMYLPIINVLAEFLKSLIRILFLLVEVAAVYSTYKVLWRKKEKQTDFGIFAIFATGFSVVSVLMSTMGVPHLPFLLALCVAIFGIDACSRVFLQNRGIEEEGDFARDYALYRIQWERYNASRKENSDRK